jgi:2,4-dienoyl-CoA reductase-like NADH-dependent reductase (Old Yellow Enzyme family)
MLSLVWLIFVGWWSSGWTARAATIQDIERVIHQFVDAAVRAHRAGFDGVELHGAHGYLLHQFLSRKTNQRKDEWGGSFENRTRLLRTIARRIREKLPRSFILGVRLSPVRQSPSRGA